MKTTSFCGFLLWIGTIVSIDAAAALSCFAAEMTAEDKIRIIEETVNQKKVSGSFDRQEIYLQIARHMPLDAADTEETRRLDRKLERLVQEKYPETDAQLKKRFEDQALSRYRCYRVGDNVKITYYLYDKPYTVSGRYYRSDASFVWIGSKKIAKSALSPETAACFDSQQSESAKLEYVARKLRDYHQAKRDYSARLLRQNKDFDAYESSRGKLRINARWMTPREYADYLIEYNILAEEAPREIGKALSSQNEVTSIIRLRGILNRCSPYPKLAAEVRKVLREQEEKHIQHVIVGISKSDDPQSAIDKLDRLIEICPEAENRDQVISMRREYESRRKQENAERNARTKSFGSGARSPGKNENTLGFQKSLVGNINPVSSENSKKCDRCHGLGFFNRAKIQKNRKSQTVKWVKNDCPKCHGTGRLPKTFSDSRFPEK